MSLLSTDITKVKRLSLGKIKLPAKERIKDPINRKSTPTEEELIYSKLVAINPLLEDLVERLNLVSINTGRRIKKVDAIVKDY
jgi:hypothetical protein